MATLNPNARLVFDYVKQYGDQNITTADIAAGTGLENRSVNGIITAAFQRKGLMERIPAEIEATNEEGRTIHKAVKFIKLTAAGEVFDPDATETTDEK